MTPPPRILASLLALAVASGCASAASPPSASPGATASASPSAEPTPTVRPTASATVSPTVSPSLSLPTPTPTPTPTPAETTPPTPTPAPTPPTAEAFWAAAASAVDQVGRLRIRVIGPSPGELRYEREASATVIDGDLIFVCREARAYDGQSGWAQLPGAWACGASALVRGFRSTGQPLDAWSSELPPDQDIAETVSLTAEGTWRWDYRGRNPFAGGNVRTVVVIDPASGQIRSASRTDPLGETTYGISYTEAFPRIAVP